MTLQQRVKTMTSHNLPLRVFAIAGLTLALSGCYVRKDTAGDIPNDYRKRHPITLKEGEKTVEIFVGSRRGGLTDGQGADVLYFAKLWKRESTGGIIIDVPAATSNEVAANGALREIRSILAAAGVPPHVVSIRPYATEADKLATIKLNYSKIVADAGPCGLWPGDLGPAAEPAYQENRNYWNLGCASQRNLAAMVANPADLVQPRGEDPISTNRRSVVLDKYRKGEPTNTNYRNEDRGKLSDIGK
jgi:pilus assembly protein CpaD